MNTNGMMHVKNTDVIYRQVFTLCTGNVVHIFTDCYMPCFSIFSFDHNMAENASFSLQVHLKGASSLVFTGNN
jgi:hypothetical protein